MGSEDKVVVKIELSKEDYEVLKAISKKEGYSLVPEYLKFIVKNIIEEGGLARGEGLQVRELSESIGKRVERIVTDLLNPYTGKIDELSRKISELREIVESLEAERAKPKPPTPTPPREPRKPVSAIDRLKDQGVVFQDDVRWMKSPDKFFDKLKKEGAVVLEVGGEKIAVDSDLWLSFKEELGKVSVSDLEEAASIIELSLGDAAGRLFRKLARAGLIVYDEDSGIWLSQVSQ
ncbi:MAG: hypothetical protein P3X22_002515 [Thermoprotei archaeon]|nr:hypothetical protein [Thermoprotei archaeon]